MFLEPLFCPTDRTCRYTVRFGGFFSFDSRVSEFDGMLFFRSGDFLIHTDGNVAWDAPRDLKIEQIGGLTTLADSDTGFTLASDVS